MRKWARTQVCTCFPERKWEMHETVSLEAAVKILQTDSGMEAIPDPADIWSFVATLHQYLEKETC